MRNIRSGELALFGSRVVRGYSEIFFVPSAGAGLLLLGLTLIRPGVGLAGIVAVLSACGFARLIRLDRKSAEQGFYFFNPLLVGLSIGFLVEITPASLVLVAAAGAMTAACCVALAHWFRTYLALPVLSMPFVLVSSVVYLALLRNSGLPPGAAAVGTVWLPEPVLPFWIAGFFEALGTILFAPSVLAGMVIAAILLFHSRILFLLAVFGYYLGAGARALMFHSAAGAFAEPNSFNFILVAMVIGGVFLVPSWRSYLLAAVAVVLCAVVLDTVLALWQYHRLPPYALPFNAVALGMLYVLIVAGYPDVAASYEGTPEQTLESTVASRLRYPGHLRTLFLPFSGRWTVWQGFDGEWTHRGPWRHACDFVITDPRGKTYDGAGSELEDYYCYRKPVLSPVQGRVVNVISNVPDCPAGRSDQADNWGNLVILEDRRGFFVEISHFAHESIRVREGDEVARGTVLGLCGNSGLSPQPHIHVQVQLVAQPGAATVPFSFTAYAAGGVFHANDVPKENERVEPLWEDRRLQALTAFNLDDCCEYRLFRDGEEVARLRYRVRMAPDGTFYYESDRGRLYFGTHAGTFYFYRVEGDDPGQRLMFAALPRLPLSYAEGLQWRDYVPAGTVMRGWRRFFAQCISTFHPKAAIVEATQTFHGRGVVETHLRSPVLGIDTRAEVRLDKDKGLAAIRCGSLELRRIDRAVASAAEPCEIEAYASMP